VLFGFVFFSAVLNKLPGYLLPLLPPLVTLMGIGLARVRPPAMAMIAPLILLGALPTIAGIAPEMLAHGARSVKIPWHEGISWFAGAGIASIILVSTGSKHAFAATAAICGVCFLWFQLATFPLFDVAASARPLWLASHRQCAPQANRSELYGLYYYAERELTPCNVLDQGTIRVVR
jgi:4-amino-4-deoxy-L-arabinose transferase-like glycosyltransferase